MTIRMYDLAGAEDERRFSPFCWRIRMALAHKGLETETIPWRFTEKDVIAFSGQGRVPVIVDGGRVVSDSWEIANYLEDAYPERPALFGCPAARGEALFVKHWVERGLHPLFARVILMDVFARMHPRDRDYFRRTREERFGTTLEAFCAEPGEWLGRLREALDPLRATLALRPFLGGDAPAFADYVVFGQFQWARCTSPTPLLESDDPIHAWRGRLLEMYDGLAGRAPGFAA